MEIAIGILVALDIGIAVLFCLGLKIGVIRFQKYRKTGVTKAVSEEEIKGFVAGNEELHDDEKQMIYEILDLGDMTVREVMQPRVDMILVQDTETVRDARERMHGTGYSRLPVYHQDPDTIIGIVHYKDLFLPIMDDKQDDPVGDYLHEALFVPETKDVVPLLTEMQTVRQHMAIVVDEYGGTDGLITIEDIMEEIVGEIIDESDEDLDEATELSEGVWLVPGRFSVENARSLGLPVAESDDYETLAGWLLETIGRVPQVGDVFDIDDYRFSVVKMRRRRVSMLRVEKRQDLSASEIDKTG